MKPKIQYIVFLLSILLIPTGLRSEITQAGQYMGSLQANGNYLYAEVHQDDSVSLYLFDYAEDRLETWELQLTDDTATAISSYGREGAFRLETWELQLTGDTSPAIATIAGESFGLSYSSEVYDQTTYEGVIFVNEEGEFQALLSRITRTAENSFVMFWGVPDDFEGGGVGSINNGQAELLTTWGETVSFPFMPTTGLGTGRANQLLGQATSESGDTAFTFALVESERASMSNISSRGWIGGGQNMIAGTVVNGGHKLLLIRAVGPTLSEYGVSTAHPDPRITLFEGQTELASNDDWAGVDIANAAAYVGAFPLSEGSKDACLLVEVAQGAYTIIVEGVGDPGEAIVEVYEVR